MSQITESLAQESALLTLRGIGINEQTKQLREKFPDGGVTRTRLLTLKNHPKYSEILKKAAEEMVSTGQIELKAGTAELVPQILACLKLKLEEGSVQAASVAVNILIDKDANSAPQQAQQIQVILPGTPPKENLT